MALETAVKKTSVAAGGVGRTPKINVTPLVDVVLVLLIIFMVVTPLLEKDIEVRVPDSEEVQEQTEVPPDQLVVSLDADAGRMKLNSDDVIATEEYVEKLTRVVAAKPRGEKLVLNLHGRREDELRAARRGARWCADRRCRDVGHDDREGRRACGGSGASARGSGAPAAFHAPAATPSSTNVSAGGLERRKSNSRTRGGFSCRPAFGRFGFHLPARSGVRGRKPPLFHRCRPATAGSRSSAPASTRSAHDRPKLHSAASPAESSTRSPRHSHSPSTRSPSP